MPATAVANFKHVSPPASIQNHPQFVDLRKAPGALADARVADPAPMLREALDGLRLMHEGSRRSP